MWLLPLLACAHREPVDSDPGCVDQGAARLCLLDDGAFHVVLPSGWDGVTPLPALMQLHGHGSDGASYAGSPGVRGALDDFGVLGLFPTGEDGRSWKVGHHVDDIARDDLDFLERVVDEARARWPITEVTLAGQSEGASMVYEALCAGTDAFAGYLPASGSFWLPGSTGCPAVAPLRHTHGLADETWPLEGREGDPWSKGGVLEGLARVREGRGCAQSPSTTSSWDGLACETWTDCEREVTLCLHEGGHSAREGWLRGHLRWMAEQAP